MRRWLLLSLLCLLLLGMNTHHQPDVAMEQMAILGDLARSGYIVSGCLPPKPASGLTVTLPACAGYGLETTPRRLVYLYDDKPRTVTLPGPGWYTIAAHASLAQPVSGWTRIAGTHVVWKSAPNGWNAAAPAGGVLIAAVEVVGGAIQEIGDLRPDNPWHERVHALAPLFGVVGDDIIDDTAALQAAINNATWRRIRTLYIPMAPKGACYAFQRLYLHYDPTNNPGAPQHANAQGRLIVQGDGHFTERDVLQGEASQFTGTCLRSIHPEGPALSLVTPVQGPTAQAGLMRADFRDLHVVASPGNTTAVILVDGVSHLRWDNLSVLQVGTTGRGVQLRDTFQFEWHGGMALGPGYEGTNASSVAGILITMPEIPFAGLMEFSQVTSRQWNTCWQYGLPQAGANMDVTLYFTQIQAKGCVHGMRFYAETRALSIVQSYLEEFLGSGIGIAGRNRAIRIEGNNIGGGDLAPGTANINLGIKEVAAGPMTTGAVSVRANNFNNVKPGTIGIHRYVSSVDDAGVELAYNSFIGSGTAILLEADTTNTYDFVLHGNQYGNTVPFATAGDGTPRPDYQGRIGYQIRGRIEQQYLGDRILVASTDTALVLNTSSNIQQVHVSGGAATVNLFTLAAAFEGAIIAGTQICLMLDEGSGNLTLDETGGNLLLAGAASITLSGTGSNACFVATATKYVQTSVTAH